MSTGVANEPDYKLTLCGAATSVARLHVPTFQNISENSLNKTETEIEIRKIGIENLDQVFEFLRPFMDQNFLIPREKDEVKTLMTHGFAAFHDQKIVGFAAVEIYSRKLAELQCLAVDPEYRRMGIAKKLVNKCTAVASETGVKELLAISASDELFMACGFEYSLPNQKRALFFQPNQD